METLTIEILDPKAIRLLEDMEEKEMIKITSQPHPSQESKGDKMVKKYAGRLSPELTERLQNYVSESREEWKQRNI